MHSSLPLEQVDFLSLQQSFQIQGIKKPHTLVLNEEHVLGQEEFDSPYVSPVHACIKLDQQGIWIKDLGSRNGSRLSGQALAPNQWLQWPLGQRVTLANCPVYVKAIQGPPAPVPEDGQVRSEWLNEAQQRCLGQVSLVRDERWWRQITGPQASAEQIKQCEALMVGLGPLEPLLADPEVSEIMVLGDRPIWVERAGRIAQTQSAFPDHDWLVRVIERVLSPIGREINQANPVCDGRLADGSRVNAVLPPISIAGPALTIRKFHTRVNSLGAWVTQGSLSSEWADWLANKVSEGRDVLVVGGTGAGKTTLLNALAEHIPGDQRIVSIEDAAELDLSHEHWVRLETRSAQNSALSLDARGLLINALRMRPDRILLGEVRGVEALELIQALNTGHRGCMSTLHANTATAATRRLEMLLMLSGLDWPLEAVREQIACALDLVVSIERDAFGQRRVSGIYELLGLDRDEYQWICHFDGDASDA